MSEPIDSRTGRIQTLKQIIKRLHAGTAPEAVKAQLAALVRETEASEIAQMEQELMAEGMSVEEIRSMCDLHAQVLREVVAGQEDQAVPPGHPVDTFRCENEALGQVVEKTRAVLAELGKLPDAAVPGAGLISRLREGFNALMDVDKHYQRKENLLFSCLERHGVTGPPKVMWAKDDEVRELLKAFEDALSEPRRTAGEWKQVAREAAGPALSAVVEMISKEDKILLPMALETLTAEEWAEIWAQSGEYGWCLVEPREGYAPRAAAAGQAHSAAPAKGPQEGAIGLSTGALTHAQLEAILATVPVDLTFVDADDKVAYFTPGRERVFARSKAIIGRKVQHCHPPKSLHVVEQILEDFRSGRQDVAEFWIELKGKFVHIRYFAVRDAAGAYLGTLEVTQDATHVRALTGERRLLEYDSPPR